MAAIPAALLPRWSLPAKAGDPVFQRPKRFGSSPDERSSNTGCPAFAGHDSRVGGDARSCRRAGCERPPEHEVVAQPRDRRAGADQVEIPGAVGGIAEQHRAEEALLCDDELLVDADG